MGSYAVTPTKMQTASFKNRPEHWQSACTSELTQEQLMAFYQLFTEQWLSPHSTYLDLNELLRYVDPQLSSMLNLPLSHLFLHTPKKYPDRLYFEEWLDAVCAYCLLSRQGIIRFTFEMLDDDEDGSICLEDVVEYLQARDLPGGRRLFPGNTLNHARNCFQQDEMVLNFDDFQKIVQGELTFMTWPCMSLQRQLRMSCLGESFWKEYYSRIEKKEKKNSLRTQEDSVSEIKPEPPQITSQQNEPNQNSPDNLSAEDAKDESKSKELDVDLRDTIKQMLRFNIFQIKKDKVREDFSQNSSNQNVRVNGSPEMESMSDQQN